MEAQIYFDLLPSELIEEIVLYLDDLSSLRAVDYRLHRQLENINLAKKKITAWCPHWNIIIDDCYKKYETNKDFYEGIYWDLIFRLNCDCAAYRYLDEVFFKEKLYRNFRWIYNDLNKIDMNSRGSIYEESKKGINFSWEDFYKFINEIATDERFISAPKDLSSIANYILTGNVVNTYVEPPIRKDFVNLDTSRFEPPGLYVTYIVLLLSINDNIDHSTQHDRTVFATLIIAFKTNFSIFEYLLRKIGREQLIRVLKVKEHIEYLEKMVFRPCFDY